MINEHIGTRWVVLAHPTQKGWESLHLYTQNGFCVPLAAVRINFLTMIKKKNKKQIMLYIYKKQKKSNFYSS